MCFVSENKKSKVAEKSFTVIKCFIKKDKKLRSCYKFFKWNIDKLYETEIEHSDEWCGHDSIHTSYLDRRFPHWTWGRNKNLICIGAGFHSLTKEGVVLRYCYPEFILYKCTIPKGAIYYQSATGEIVSNKIIVRRRTNIDKLKLCVK